MSFLGKRFFQATIISVLAFGFALHGERAAAQTAKLSGEISSKLRKAMNRNATGCLNTRKEIRRLGRNKRYSAYHFAFAGRKDRTITGMKGCGYAWNVDLEGAQNKAMAECRKWEVKYGTGDGEKTCRFMK